MTMGKIPVNAANYYSCKFAFFIYLYFGGGRYCGFWIHVSSCLSYLKAMCFESYVGHSLASEIAVVDIHYLLANAGIACSYSCHKFQDLSNWLWTTIISHLTWRYVTKNNMHMTFVLHAVHYFSENKFTIYSIPRVLSIFNLTSVVVTWFTCTVLWWSGAIVSNNVRVLTWGQGGVLLTF